MVFFLFADSEQSTLSIPMDKTTVFYIAVGVACSIILIIALAVAAIHLHSMPSANKESRLVCKDQSILTNPQHFLKCTLAPLNYRTYSATSRDRKLLAEKINLIETDCKCIILGYTVNARISARGAYLIF